MTKFRAATSVAVILLSAGAISGVAALAKEVKSNSASGASAGAARLETYKDLINKAKNLTLQRDRLQTSQVLIRAIQSEPKGSSPYKELVRALSELSGVFYTDKAQNLFAVAESLAEQKPREAIDGFQEALKVEEGNVTVLKALARAHLRGGDCDRAEAAVKTLESLNPYSGEVRLLRLQTLDCQKRWDQLSTGLAGSGSDFEGVEPFLKGLIVKELLHRRELKKAKAALQAWESQAAGYPEVDYWKWQYGQLSGAPDRASAIKYVQLCQNLTPRKRKSYNLDVDLCKGKEAVDAFLKESGFVPSSPTEGAPSESKN